MMALEAHGLEKSFGAVCAVDKLDLEIPKGAVTAFLGPNGAGKTTTLRMLLGLIRPDRGHIEVFGRPFSSDTRGEGRRETLRRVGGLIEEPTLYGHLSGLEHLEIVRRYRGLPKSSSLDTLRSMGLEAARNRKVSEYSLGMRQRLGIAMALAPDPDLLLLDEPMNGLDPAGIQELRQALREMAHERGMAVFLSSHLLTEVSLLADRFCILRQGKRLFSGPAADLQDLAKSRLRISTTSSTKALECLRQAGVEAQVLSNQTLIIELDSQGLEPQKEAARLNHLLVTHQCDVFELAWQNSSLEEAFLELTNQDDSPRPEVTER
ncbi:MAG: ABC transporter ATP-binding protein [Deltaproteobacteria bacterium]|nr:ABC transporter ATP-binding protein [Deltaproteobacteria bacterium]